MAIVVRDLKTNECHLAAFSFSQSPDRSAYPVLQLVDSGLCIDPDGWVVDWVDDVEREAFPAGWRLPPEDADRESCG